MVSLLESAADPSIVGFDAGWKMTLRAAGPTGEPIEAGKLEISRNDYSATVRVERTSAFRAPSFDVVIDGLADQHHHTIVGAPLVFVQILLGWRDLGSGAAAPFADIGSLLTGSAGDDANYTEVIHGRLHTYERLHGEFRYRTHLAGIDRRFHRLRCTTASQPAVEPGAPAMRYAELLAQQAGVPIVKHPPAGPWEPIDEVIEVAPTRDDEERPRREPTVAQALQHLARQAHGGGRDRQIPMFVGVDGLHVGPWAASTTGDQLPTKRLEMTTGLVECKPVVSNEPDECADPMAVPTVLRFDLTLRGRADLAVGDKVEVDVDVPAPGTLPPTIAGSVLGGIGDMVSGVAAAFGPSVAPDFTTFRIVSVKHELDRSKGFVTSVRAERQAEQGSGDATEPVANDQTRSLDEAARTAIALAAQSRAERQAVLDVDIGLVVAQSTRFQSVDGRAFAPQRLEVDEGLDDLGVPNDSVVAHGAAAPTRLFNKPYLTPFACGSTGLVVPHYPGTRVLGVHYREDVRNTIVAGCLWNDADEPESQPGDYWLSLPTEYSPQERADRPGAVEPPSGPAVHDLIDGHGGRAVHVRGLRISVGQDLLVDVGQRPDAAVADEVLIEHDSGASIRIDADGNITISTDADLTFRANKITMNVDDSVEVVG